MKTMIILNSFNNNVMKDLSIKLREKGKKEDRTAELIIEGDLTITYVEKFRDKVLDVMENYPKIDIKLQNIENIDLCAIQLLLSIRQSISPERFKLHVALRDDLKRLVEHAGFAEKILN